MTFRRTIRPGAPPARDRSCLRAHALPRRLLAVPSPTRRRRAEAAPWSSSSGPGCSACAARCRADRGCDRLHRDATGAPSASRREVVEARPDVFVLPLPLRAPRSFWHGGPPRPTIERTTATYPGAGRRNHPFGGTDRAHVTTAPPRSWVTATMRRRLLMAILPPVAGFVVKLALEKIRGRTDAATRSPFPSDPNLPTTGS